MSTTPPPMAPRDRCDEICDDVVPRASRTPPLDHQDRDDETFDRRRNHHYTITATNTGNGLRTCSSRMTGPTSCVSRRTVPLPGRQHHLYRHPHHRPCRPRCRLVFNEACVAMAWRRRPGADRSARRPHPGHQNPELSIFKPTMTSLRLRRHVITTRSRRPTPQRTPTTCRHDARSPTSCFPSLPSQLAPGATSRTAAPPSRQETSTPVVLHEASDDAGRRAGSRDVRHPGRPNPSCRSPSRRGDHSPRSAGHPLQPRATHWQRDAPPLVGTIPGHRP